MLECCIDYIYGNSDNDSESLRDPEIIEFISVYLVKYLPSDQQKKLLLKITEYQSSLP